jgi:hypothetical protein
MNIDRYQLKAGKNLVSFEFISIGPKGRIPKLIYFKPTDDPGVHNLAFGDKDLKTGRLDDLVVSDNGDSVRILATVVGAVYAFTDKYPNVWVFATGSTAARNRLYRMGVSKYFEKANDDFYILGESNNAWEPFVVGKDYEAFVVKRK